MKWECPSDNDGNIVLPALLSPSPCYAYVLMQVIDGCVCVNPGHLTKKTSGGTFAKIMVSEQSQTREDLSQAIAVQIVHI